MESAKHNETPKLDYPQRERSQLPSILLWIILAAIIPAVLSVFILITSEQSTALPFATDQLFDRVMNLVFICLLTAIVEETVFRGILLNWLFGLFNSPKRSTKTRRRATVLAIIISSVIFAALHIIPLGITTNPAIAVQQSTDALIITIFFTAASFGFKFFQALAFGLIMAYIVISYRNSEKYTKGLIIVIAIHSVFDIIYFALPVLATGEFPTTYVQGSVLGLVSLVMSIACMSIPLVKMAKFVRS